jgi:murein L,D-transpeptidase YafK
MKKHIITLPICLVAYAVVVLCAPAELSAFQTVTAESSQSSGNKNIEKINVIRAIVYAWAQTWEKKDFNNYMNYYSPKFQTGDIGYHLWREKKTKVFQRPGNISIEINDLWVFVEGNLATASFIQTYQDDKYSDIGEKILKLIHINGTWLIISESWKPLKR